MVRRPLPQPTEVELQILKILWDLGPSPVREIHKRLEEAKGTNYSTTVKMLSVMLEKGLVTRDEKAQPLIWRAVLTRDMAGQRMVNDVINKIYNGSATGLVLQALASCKASPEEMAEVRKLLDEMERKQS